uniref:Uncharacterized protein MANES_17G112100 n=1 Tax=Rhizophora mucronata TaxID=61149 RepID=A0A2P2KNT8_RHIMU
MLPVAFFIISLLVIVEHTASHFSSGPHIADVNLLLPPKMTHPVEYRLQGSDGCFKWSWDHRDILSVLPEYNISSHCSTSARLKSIAPYSGQKETAVYATDVHSGIVIRCKVFIDNISRIQIFHNSIKLDLDGLATLRVRAFDSEDNVFSSLVGLQFMWRLMTKVDESPHHLVHVRLKDSPLSDCGGLCGDLDIQRKLEDSGVFSDLYVVKGIGIGHEDVSVNLLEPHLENMADQIGLTVAEAMSLEPPSPVFVLIGAVFQYCLKVIRGNIPQVVILPSPHHKWFVTNSSVAEVDAMMGLTHASSLGVTTVIVEDTRVANHIQVSSLNVVIPDSVCLFIRPLSISGDPVEGTKTISSATHWHIVSGRQYLIHLKVFSQGPDAQEIYITENDDIRLHDNKSEHWAIFLPSEDIVVKHGWRNSRILRAISPGWGDLIASLTYFSGRQEAKEVLKSVQEIIVCDQVTFSLDKVNGSSQAIVLPWAPAVYQEVELRAIGGCAKASNDFKWFSSDPATLSISTFGVVQAKKPGKATVRVVSIFDSFNYDEVVIEVAVPSSMTMLQTFPVETVVGSHLQAAITLKSSNGAYFYRCNAFHSSIRWKAGSESFLVVNATEEPPMLLQPVNVELYQEAFGPPCSWTYVYASSSGHTILHATLLKEYLQLDQSFHGPSILKASARIAAYQPLTVHQVVDGSQFGGYWLNLTNVEASSQLENLGKLYLVPGTSLDLMLLGGPERWDKGVDFIETVDILDDMHTLVKDGVHVHQISGGYQSLYRMLCQTLGTFKLAFKRGNLVGADHPLPAIAEATLSLTCSFPSSIVQMVDEPVNKYDAIRAGMLADRGLEKIRVTPITVANGRTVRVAAVGVDASAEVFANSSSLSLKWELSSCERLAYWDDSCESKRSRSCWERFLVLQNDSGECIVRASVAGFDDKMDSHLSAQLQSSKAVLTDAIRLQLVSTLRINPEFNLLLFNPDAKVNLSIIGGSCFWEPAVNDSQVVEVMQPSPSLHCLQLTLSPKGLGAALVTVYDIGLTPPVAASAVVQVADIDWIKIVSGEEISLMEGQSEYIGLMAGVNDGTTFDSQQFAYMKIQVFMKDQIVELVDSDDITYPGGRYVSAQRFKIVARDLGITNLYVSARQQSGQEVMSRPIKVEVYGPLRIYPHDIFLVPGASYVLAVKGGPTIGAYVEYSSLDDKIATVERSSGRLSAISPGNTTILSTAYGNGDVVICEAYGNVIVGVPSSAILSVQSEQLDVGREMPIYPSFPEGDLFSFYAICGRYNWSIDDNEVLSLYMAESLHGEKWFPLDGEDLRFIKVLHGRSAGQTNVAIAFKCDFVSTSYSESRVYEASRSLSVVPGLPLALGTPITWLLPPHYVTSGLLLSSLESKGNWDGRTHKRTITYSLLRSCGDKNEVWPKDGISIDGDRIKTTESNNLACIQAKDRTTGKMEIASCVRVAEVAQIRITNKEFPLRVIYLPISAELDLPISYFDALGNRFYEAHNVVPYFVNTDNHNIVSVGHTTNSSGNVRLKAVQHGRALVRASINNNPRKSDYILISVGAARIYPQNPILWQGTSVNFSIEGAGNQVSGHWHSANESVICVDMKLGRAEAVGSGSTQVFFDSPSTKLQTTVTVLLGNIISVDAPKKVLTNVPYPTEGYKFSVKFSDTYKEIEAVGKTKGVSYDCKVDPPFLGSAKPWVDPDTGNSYCLLFPQSPEHLTSSIPGSKDIKQYVFVSVNASSREASHVSGSASAVFVGGFSILELNEVI